MRFPWQLHRDLTLYLVKNRLQGRKHFPLVLMLEPLHLCNLACDGCGKIREYKSTIQDKMTLEDCLAKVDESGAPVISVCGGEPLIYPEIDGLVNGIVDRKKHLIVCTNAIGLQKHLDAWPRSPYLTINVSMDGQEKNHDLFRGRKGLYKIDMRAIADAKKAGFRVMTNTTVYKETDVAEVEGLLDELSRIGVDGFLVAPAFAYTSVEDDIFMDREQIHRKFKYLQSLSQRYRYINSPLYMQFLAGERMLDCTPWGNITVNPQGWKGPCYLITDAHYKTMAELFEATDWDKYEKRNDPRCTNCMMSCSVEPTVAREAGSNWKDLVQMVRWNLS